MLLVIAKRKMKTNNKNFLHKISKTFLISVNFLIKIKFFLKSLFTKESKKDNLSIQDFDHHFAFQNVYNYLLKEIRNKGHFSKDLLKNIKYYSSDDLKRLMIQLVEIEEEVKEMNHIFISDKTFDEEKN